MSILQPLPKQDRRARLRWTMAACVLMALLWPISYVVFDRLLINIGHRQFWLESGPAWMAFTLTGQSVPGPHPWISNKLVTLNAIDRQARAFPRIYSAYVDYRFYTPLWVVSLVAGVMGSSAAVSYARQNRLTNTGLCAVCGYDLRATPDRCPECGNVNAVKT